MCLYIHEPDTKGQHHCQERCCRTVHVTCMQQQRLDHRITICAMASTAVAPTNSHTCGALHGCSGQAPQERSSVFTTLFLLPTICKCASHCNNGAALTKGPKVLGAAKTTTASTTTLLRKWFQRQALDLGKVLTKCVQAEPCRLTGAHDL